MRSYYQTISPCFSSLPSYFPLQLPFVFLSLYSFSPCLILPVTTMSGQGLGIKNTALSSSYVEYIEKQRMFGTPLTSSSSITPLLDDSLGTGPKTPSSPFLQSYKRGRGRAYRRLEWYSTVGIFATGIYSTLLSGVWLVIALKKPHWGSFINSNGSVLTPATASTLATAIAKTIEISFLTFFLAMMGQYLTRRAASDQNASGISLADLQLKVLLVLPGTLFTQWRNYGRSLRSMLGVISLIACFSAMLYTTASDSVGQNICNCLLEKDMLI